MLNFGCLDFLFLKHNYSCVLLALVSGIVVGFGSFTSAEATSSREVHENARGCIRGQILGPDGKGMKDVLLHTDPLSSPKLTPSDGRFLICYRRIASDPPTGFLWRKALPPGLYQLHVLKVGYFAHPVSFSFQRKDLVLPPIQMRRLPRPLCVAQTTPPHRGLFVKRTCWPNGASKTQETFQKGHRNGPFAYVNQTGQLCETGVYRKGRIHGLYQRWNSRNGTTQKALFADGKRRSPWKTFPLLRRLSPSSRVKTLPANKAPTTRKTTSRPTSRPNRPKVRAASTTRPSWFAPPSQTSAALPRHFSHLPLSQQRKIFRWIERDETLYKLFSSPWIASIRAKQNRVHHKRLFLLDASKRRHYRLRVVAFGEAKCGEMTDYAWLEHRHTGQQVWRMYWSNTTADGPDSRNRRADQIIQLPAGEYVLHYRTDATHSPAGWITEPPRHAGRYGVVLYHLDSLGYKLLVSSGKDKRTHTTPSKARRPITKPKASKHP